MAVRFSNATHILCIIVKTFVFVMTLWFQDIHTSFIMRCNNFEFIILYNLTSFLPTLLSKGEKFIHSCLVSAEYKKHYLTIYIALCASCFTDDVCFRPAFTGPCNASFRRYHWNKDTCKCERFTYGGCQDNGNNFKTKAGCIKVCGRSPCHTG